MFNNFIASANMKKLLKSGLLVFSLLVPLTSHSQELKLFNQFFMNPFIFNPAYAGTEGHSVVYALYRSQFPGLDAGPEISHLSFNTPLKKGLGFGVFAMNERKGNSYETNQVKVSSSYLVSFDQKHFLRFGMSLGAVSGAPTPETSFDLATKNLTGNIQQYTSMLAEFGITYHWGHFNFGFALPTLIGYNEFPDNSFATPRARPHENAIFKVNYRGHLGDALAIEPHIIYRYEKFGVSQLQFTGILHILHQVWVGGAYTQDEGITALAGIKISDKMGVGGSYNVGGVDAQDIIGNTMEISVGVHLGRKKKHTKHVSSFIKSHRKTLEERRAEAEKKRQEKLAKLQEEDRQKLETVIEPDPAQQPPPTADESTEFDDEEEEANSFNDDAIVVEEVVETEEPVVVKEKDASKPSPQPKKPEKVESKAKQKPTRKEKESLSDDRRSYKEIAKSDEPLRVKPGHNLLELQQGYYVIAGSFNHFQHAENYSDDLFERGFHDVKVGYVSARGHYYTILTSSNSVSEAIKQRNKFKSLKGLDSIWVLVVE